MKKVGKYLRSLDLFGEPTFLTLFKQKRYVTYTGAFTSFFMVLALFLISYSKLESMIYKSTTYIQNQETIDPTPPYINMKYRFALEMDPAIMGSVAGKRYFDYYNLVGNFQILKNGTLLKTKNIFKLVPCTPEHFPMISEDQLLSAGIKNWICPDYTTDYDFSIRGKFNDDVYHYIQISITKCTSNQHKAESDSCASDEEIQVMRNTYGKFYVNLVMINNIMNLNNFEQPFTPYVDRATFLIDIKNLFVQKEYFINSVEVVTDDSWSFNAIRNYLDAKVEKSIIFEGKYDEYNLHEITFVNKTEAFASIYLRSAKLSKKFTRKYDTLQDYLQALGAFYSILFLIFKFVSNKLTHKGKIFRMAQALYNFEEPEQQIKQPDKNSFHDYIKNGCCKKILKDKNLGGYSIDVIDKQINKDLDLISILSKFKVLNNLKHVTLTPDQNIILDVTGKEHFSPVHLKQGRAFAKLSISHSLKSKQTNDKKRIQLAFNHLMEDKENTVSKKIIEHFNSSESRKKKFDLKKMINVKTTKIKFPKEKRRVFKD